MADIPKPNFSNALWASGGAIVAPSNVKVATGWTAEVPPFQWENWSQNRQDQGIAHILQHGLSVWDTLTEYQANKSYVQGSDGLIYKAVQTNTNQNPVTDTARTYWNKDFTSGLLLNTQIITASGTVTKTPGAKKWRVRGVGGGGQGGGTQATSGTQIATGGGASCGSSAEAVFDVSAISSATATIGSGGSGAAAAAVGTAGGSTTLVMGASSLTLPGGPGGQIGAAMSALPNDGGGAATFSVAPSHVGATVFEGTQGGGATTGINLSLASAQAGIGGSTQFGSSRQAGNAVGYGAGGPGARSLISTAAASGAQGAPGLLIIDEYS